MAATFVPIDTTKRLGSNLRRAVDVLRDALDQLNKVKNIMDTQVDGTDYSVVEAQFGLPAGNGAAVYSLVTGALTAIDVAAVRKSLDRLG